MKIHSLISLVLSVFIPVAVRVELMAQSSLESLLAKESPEQLAREARERGDASRGAIVFFQPTMACSKCHIPGMTEVTSIGPELTSSVDAPSDSEIVESILFPSRRIRKGFESITVLNKDGSVQSGILLAKSQEAVTIRDVSSGVTRQFPAEEIESWKQNAESMMPKAQLQALSTKQQFLDLVLYLIEIRDGGIKRAKELQPSPNLLLLSVPSYESRIDHAGMIRGWNDESIKRGESIYNRVCANCHGTLEQVGSLPTSLRFAEGKFKNGSDPYSMYKTLTYGFGQMTPQTWMVPQQKYDVIHFIRERYLKDRNPSQWKSIDEEYLKDLPVGDEVGPPPSKIQPWNSMDYGNTLTHTYSIPGDRLNIAYKGIAVRLDPGPGGIARGSQWMVFESDTLRVAAGWIADESNERFINWRGIQFNGEHQVHPTITGRVQFANSIGPGWGEPATGSFSDDQRITGRDGRQYGPLPKPWGKFRGIYHGEKGIVFSYSIGKASVLESPWMFEAQEGVHAPVFARRIRIGARDRELVLQVAEASAGGKTLLFGTIQTPPGIEWLVRENQLRLAIQPGSEPIELDVCLAVAEDEPVSEKGTKTVFKEYSFDRFSQEATLRPGIATQIAGAPSRWPQKLVTEVMPSHSSGPFAIDTLAAPENNPWLAQMRFTGLDFLPDGRIVVCTWDGDVWMIERLREIDPVTERQRLSWRRIATGLFQPLGLKIHNNRIHLTCRDQLVVLHDLNGDEEIDFYECLNNDHQVTEHFHEFAMGLQTDEFGNFYYAKSARHALKAIVPHHGTLLKVSADGLSTEIVAHGFRAANGVCLNQDGSFVVTDQEGHWNPKNRINWVKANPGGKPRFYGNLFGYTEITDPSDDVMEKPLCWITNAFDRSPGELLWVDSSRWGALQGSLLNLSYGYGKAYLVPHEKLNDQMQGGMIELPIPNFPTGVMRGRFDPGDGQLIVCGMFAWAGSAQHPGGLYRIRATGEPFHLPLKLHATRKGISLSFSDPLTPESVLAEKIQVKTWSLKRTANYGSKHFDEKELRVAGVRLADDNKSVWIELPEIAPTWCMEIRYEFRSSTNQSVVGTIHNTIHQLAE